MQVVKSLTGKILLLSTVLLFACNTNHKDKPSSVGETRLETITLVTPSGKELTTELAVREEDQIQGLSGRPDKSFGPLQAMLFYYEKEGTRSFWMPDTYFNLNIIFLKSDLTVVDISRDVEHHPGRKTPPPIARTPTVWAHHVLEIRADSPVSEEIRPGVKLKLKGSRSLSEIVRDIHP